MALTVLYVAVPVLYVLHVAVLARPETAGQTPSPSNPQTPNPNRFLSWTVLYVPRLSYIWPCPGLDCLMSDFDCLTSGFDCIASGLDCLISGLACLNIAMTLLYVALTVLYVPRVAVREQPETAGQTPSPSNPHTPNPNRFLSLNVLYVP